uniref:Reverse transcriptase domain-containing protein n=1 Tax=Tanacetum cinerariifolium TaxID=118510 RepID=A0A699IF21_TANCI|nr:hypothetical protein [Tanacetum cinerariifolium]
MQCPKLIQFTCKTSASQNSKANSTILETESDELIKSSVENLVPIPSESENFSVIESECDVPDCEDSQTINFLTFSNPLFEDSTSSDDESSYEEVIHEMSFKTYSNPLFDLDEEIISSEFNSIHNEDLDSTPKTDRFDTKSYLLESLLNRDTLMASSPKFDSFLEEFFGELAYTDLILPGTNEASCDPEEDIHLVERLLYDNSSPRPPKEFNSENSNAIIESFSPFPIPVEDSDSLMEEIYLFLTLDDSMPPGIENDDYDYEGDILFLEELISNDSHSLLENESFHFDVLSLLPTQPTLASNEEKSVHLLSHRGFKAFQLSSESPMMIYGGDSPTLDVLFSISIPLDELKYGGSGQAE